MGTGGRAPATRNSSDFAKVKGNVGMFNFGLTREGARNLAAACEGASSILMTMLSEVEQINRRVLPTMIRDQGDWIRGVS